MLVKTSYAVNQPSIESEGIVLAITEATIIKGQNVTLLMPSEAASAKLYWKKGEETIGDGLSLTITDFQKSKAGSYKLIHLLPNGVTLETNFQLNFLSLGEDIDACQAQIVDFDVPNGPVYNWSTGSLSNNFRITFEESATVSVSAITEFGHVIKDEKVIIIAPDTEANPINQPSQSSNNTYIGRA